MAGDVLPARVGDAVGRNHVGGAAGIGDGAGAADRNIELGGQAVDQGVRGTGQGSAVIQLTGGLGSDGDAAGNGPVSVSREGILLLILFTDGLDDETVEKIRTVFKTIDDTLHIVLRDDLLFHKTIDIFRG